MLIYQQGSTTSPIIVQSDPTKWMDLTHVDVIPAADPHDVLRAFFLTTEVEKMDEMIRIKRGPVSTRAASFGCLKIVSVDMSVLQSFSAAKRISTLKQLAKLDSWILKLIHWKAWNEIVGSFGTDLDADLFGKFEIFGLLWNARPVKVRDRL